MGWRQKATWCLSFFVAPLFVVLHSVSGFVIARAMGGDIVPAAVLSDLFVLATCVCLIVAIYGRVELPRDARTRRTPMMVVGFAVLLVACWYVGQVGAAWVYALGDSSYSMYEMHGDEATMFAIVSVVVAPLVEEVMYRDVSYDTMRQCGVHPVLCAAWTAFAFAVNHGTMTHMIPMLLLGMTLAAAREFFGSFWPCVGMHVAYNLLSILVMRMVPMPAWPLWVVVLALGGIGVVTACVLVLVGRFGHADNDVLEVVIDGEKEVPEQLGQEEENYFA